MPTANTCQLVSSHLRGEACSLGCGTNLRGSDARQNHEARACVNRKVACTLKCGRMMMVKDLNAHVRHACGERVVPCGRCGWSGPHHLSAAHRAHNCAMRECTCLYCGE